jgi:hypothetical protein
MTFTDGTNSVPALRRVWREERRRLVRQTRKQRLAVKHAFLLSVLER